jgi:multidrug efflux system membrane fusion protein
VTIDDPDSRVLLGMTAKVRFLRRDGQPRLTVALSALFQRDGQPALWVVAADQTVSLRPVVLAGYREDTAILESGAQAGERIVIAGVHKLTEGERIRLIERAPRPAEPAPAPPGTAGPMSFAQSLRVGAAPPFAGRLPDASC